MQTMWAGGDRLTVIEEGVPLSASRLFTMQRRYYQREGIRAWSEGTVPLYITSNAFIARSYAHVIFGWLLDVARQARKGKDPGRVYIVELGSGHGRFGYLCLSALLALKRSAPVPTPDITWVMTDLAQENVAFLAQHPRLVPLAEGGLLDFAVFDAERGEALHLIKADKTLIPTSSGMVVVANYVFDSLVQDIFRLQNGELEACKLKLTLKGDVPEDLDDPALLPRLSLSWTHHPAEPYGDVDLDGLVQEYCGLLGNTAFGLPVGAIRCIRRLMELSRGKMLLVSADKGFNHVFELSGRGEPGLVLHGSFSLMVDYHAIGAFLRRHGGSALHTTEREANLVVSAFVLGGSLRDFPQTKLAFDTHIEGFGPIDFFLLQERWHEPEKAPLQQVMSLLRLSDYDPGTLYNFRQNLKDQAGEGGEMQRLDILAALPRVWEHFYHIADGKDVPFELARIYQKLGRCSDAAVFYHRSMELFGEDAITWYNLGLCHYSLGELGEAARCLDTSLGLNPDYGPAREWRLRVSREWRA